jgi:hypothetical protein
MSVSMYMARMLGQASAARCRRVIALIGTRSHGRGRSRSPMHSLSKEQTSLVPTVHNYAARAA